MKENSQRIEEVLELCVNFNFRRLARKLASRYDQAFQELDLKTTQYSLLAAVHAAGSPSLAELCEGMALDRTTLLRNLVPLERRGLLASPDGQKGQKRQVALTEEGRQLLRRAYEKWRAAQKEAIRTIGRSEWKDLSNELKNLSARL